ncbi:PREDICTED: PIH1 domain-containing protein 1-like [Dinoponera quadriceps]|uniref:PIH1 domain-containing protein 1-like n=1 Tax=Dinoponera quadriceps TaxID=609295 RepID=A0A6P3X1P5_DINQU|nr:PREDICTED: PIH1 domain-containing protein 1-like [Dinoponera quadriceps]
MSDSTFLDIDESIQTRNLLILNEERDGVDHQIGELMKQYEPALVSVIQPVPGICVKIKSTSEGKVFINICMSDEIPAPQDISDDKLFQVLDDHDSTYSLPMSIGAERVEKDKSGVPCPTFDVVINTAYLTKCQQKPHFMAFTILSVLNGVMEKSGKELDMENYTILKNRTVVGKLQQQRIRVRERKIPQRCEPLIEEIPKSKKSASRKVCLQESDKAEREVDYVILRQPPEGPVERLIALFNMPRNVSIENVVVLINPDRINVTDEKTCCSHDVLLPYNIKTDSAKAYLDYSLKVLRIDILAR